MPAADHEAAIAAMLSDMSDGLSLAKACVKHGIKRSNFLFWVEQDKELADRYTRARSEMLDVHAEGLEDIGEQAAKATDAVTVAGLRLQSDNRKWLLARLANSKYGDKQDHTLSAPGGGPVQNSLTVTFTSPKCE